MENKVKAIVISGYSNLCMYHDGCWSVYTSVRIGKNEISVYISMCFISELRSDERKKIGPSIKISENNFDRVSDELEDIAEIDVTDVVTGAASYVSEMKEKALILINDRVQKAYDDRPFVKFETKDESFALFTEENMSMIDLESMLSDCTFKDDGSIDLKHKLTMFDKACIMYGEDRATLCIESKGKVVLYSYSIDTPHTRRYKTVDAAILKLKEMIDAKNRRKTTQKQREERNDVELEMKVSFFRSIVFPAFAVELLRKSIVIKYGSNVTDYVIVEVKANLNDVGAIEYDGADIMKIDLNKIVVNVCGTCIRASFVKAMIEEICVAKGMKP